MRITIVAIIALLAASLAAPSRANDAATPIVAAENFYGDIAAQIGGPYVKVTSILANPDQDPHLFEASPSVGRAVSAARFVIYNGMDYDPWMTNLLGAAKSRNRQSIVIAELTGRKSGDNPHIWYEPATMLALAKNLSSALSREDPAHRGAYARRLARFEQSLDPIRDRIASLRKRYRGIPVTATEPIFGYMFDALGMIVRNRSFQLAVMNNTEPSASDIAGLEGDLTGHKVRLLIYNSQATDPIADRMEKIAKASHVAVVGATETEPAGKNYQSWMLSQLDALDHALSESSK